LLKAIEEKTFFPFGSDKEVSSDFQLIAGTHRDMPRWVAAGHFRDDLYARINMWTFPLPGLAERREDIEPNIDFELQRFAETQQLQVRFDHEARQRFLGFACSPQAPWRGNFRELGASVVRMATLADNGRITPALVDEEILRLQKQWAPGDAASAPLPESVGECDLFDRLQLESVLNVCRQASSLSEAGRRLFAVSRQQKKQPNDADRLRKFLARFALCWDDVKHR